MKDRFNPEDFDLIPEVQAFVDMEVKHQIEILDLEQRIQKYHSTEATLENAATALGGRVCFTLEFRDGITEVHSGLYILVQALMEFIYFEEHFRNMTLKSLSVRQLEIFCKRFFDPEYFVDPSNTMTDPSKFNAYDMLKHTLLNLKEINYKTNIDKHIQLLTKLRKKGGNMKGEQLN